MDIYFMCPVCEQKLVVDREGAGLHVNCPNCAQRLIIPDAPASTSPRSIDVEFLPPDEAAAPAPQASNAPSPSPPPPKRTVERLDKTVFIPHLGAPESQAQLPPAKPSAPKQTLSVPLAPAPTPQPPPAALAPLEQPSPLPPADARPDQTVKISFEPPAAARPQSIIGAAMHSPAPPVSIKFKKMSGTVTPAKKTNAFVDFFRNLFSRAR